LKNWPGFDDTGARQKRLLVSVFLLEELNLHLEENDNPLLFRLDKGCDEFLSEFSRALVVLKS